MLDKKLLLLDFETDSSVSGLLFTNNIGGYKDDPNVSFDEILTLHLAQELKASAVYFRRIGESSIPQLFIFDNSADKFSSDYLIEVHKKLWSSGIVPVYYIFDETEVRIFNCRKPLDSSGRKLKIDPFDSLPLTAKTHAQYKKYSAKLFENESFWETEENRDRFKADNSSNNKLIDELKRIQKKFSENQNVDICNKLLVLSILVKYLDGGKEKKGNPAALKPEYFNRYDKAGSFCDVLRKNK